MIEGKIYWPVLGILVLFGLLACEKATVTNVATADVFVKTIINKGDTLFGVAHSVFSYNKMSSVSVKSPSGDSIPLPGNVDGGISIFKDPSLTSEDYNKVLPLTGIYTYNVTFKDKTQQVYTNALGANFLLPAVIDSLVKSQDGLSVLLKWRKVEGAQFYQVRVTKGNSEIIPAELISQEAELKFELPISSFSRYSPGTFTIELDALLYESTNYSQLQALSISYGSITLQ